MKRLIVLGLPFALAGCGLPPAIVIASYALDGVSFLASGKSVGDHAISAVVNRDCALWRVVDGRSICQNFADGEKPILVAADAWAERDTAYAGEGIDGVPIEGALALDAGGGGVVQTAARIDDTPPDERILLSLGGLAVPGAAAPDAALMLDDDLRATGVVIGWGPPAGEVRAPARGRSAPAARAVLARTLTAPASGTYRAASSDRVVVIGSFQKRLNADREIVRWAALGARLSRVTVSGNRYFRVVSRAVDAGTAARYRVKLRRSGVADVWTVDPRGAG